MDTTVMDDKTKTKNAKKAKRPKTKLAKAAIAIIVVVAVAFVGIGGFLFAANADRSYKLYTNLIISLAPKSITNDERRLTFYIEKNKDYDGKTDPENPLSAFNYYYKDDNGKKVYVNNGVYSTGVTGDEPTYVGIGFLFSAKQNLDKLITGFKIVMAVLAFVEIALCIGLWYQSWSRRQEEAKKELYGSNK